MSKRFIVEEKNIQKVDEDTLIVKGKEAHHINVLRFNVGDYTYINGFKVEISKVSKDNVTCKIIGKLKNKGVPKVNISLIQSYLKSDKMEYVTQKAVELGVKEIIPVITKNTVVKLDEKDKIKKIERLSKIAKEAIEQCGRSDNVSIDKISFLKEINWDLYDFIIVCHETSNTSLKKTIGKIKEITDLKKIAVLVGPEDGLDQSAVTDILNFNNSKAVSLGERILRAETASTCILSILSYEFE